MILRSAAQRGTGDIFKCSRISTSSGHQWSPAPTIYFNAVRLQYQNIDGHLLRLCIFYAVISTSSGRHGKTMFGEAKASQGH